MVAIDSGEERDKNDHKPHVTATKTPDIYQHEQQELLARHKRCEQARRS